MNVLADCPEQWDSPAAVYYVVDALVAARTLYGLLKVYFRTKFERQLLETDTESSLEDTHRAARVTKATPKVEGAQLPNQVDDVRATSHVDSIPRPISRTKPIRVYMDGCFDVMHFGHANALRQAKALGDILVVGINPEYEILKHKGPPVMTDSERFIAVSSVKWVDEVLTDVPYEVTRSFLDRLIHEHEIDIIVHGDDPCFGADGQDVYKAVKSMGRFRTIKRTEGVSSTDIVGRMLKCTRDHHLEHLNQPAKQLSSADSSSSDSNDVPPSPEGKQALDPISTRVSTFLPTTRRLIQFASGPRAPAPGDRVVYVDGTFDMFHAGHIETLRAARERGEFLLVGIHDDATVNAHKGSNYPIMNLHERTLSVLSCKYVDEVIIGTPWCVTQDMITTMNIKLVVHGSHHDPHFRLQDNDPYLVPKALGIYEEVPSAFTLTVPIILQRVTRNRLAFLKRNAKKERTELEYLTNHKVFVPER